MRRLLLLLIVLLCSGESFDAQFRLRLKPGVVVESGEHPVLLITSAYTTRWGQMRTDYLADTTCTSYGAGTGTKLACQLYKDAIDASETTCATTRYGCYGLIDAWLANIPGNSAATYCARSWAKIDSGTSFGLLHRSGYGSNGLGGVFSNFFFLDYVLMYDWCYDSFTQPQRDEMLTKLNDMAEIVSTGSTNPANPSWRCPDVDQPIGDYFGTAALYEATKAYNSTVVTIWARANYGGYTASALNCATAVGTSGNTARNQIAYYYSTGSAGGAWFEGTEYGFSTDSGLGMGVIANEVLKTTAAAGLFPEIDDYVDDFARWLTHLPTPDGLQHAQNGDNDNPRTFATRMMWDYGPIAMVAVGLLPDANADRQLLQRRLLDLYVQHGVSFYSPRREKIYPLYDPYATAAADLSTLAAGHYSPGAALTIWREGNSANDCQFWSHFPTEHRAVDHYMDYFGDWQLYCQGEWAVTHPIKYGSQSVFSTKGQSFSSDFVNGTMIEGLSGFPETFAGTLQYRRVVGHVIGSDFVYTAGTQGGARWGETPNGWDGAAFYEPPPRFVHEHTRSLLMLGTSTKTYMSVLQVDRINAVDPESLERFARYEVIRAGHGDAIQAAPRWSTYLHQLTNPTIAGLLTTWTTDGGQLIRDLWLAPDAVTITEEDEDTLTEYDVLSATEATEKDWRTKIEPTSDVQWNCLSRITTQRDSGVAAPVETELTPTNNAAGLLLTRTGNDDRVVVWNCAQGADISQLYPTVAQATTILSAARWRATGSYTFTYTQTTATAKVFLLDLNPALTWAYTLDGGSSVGITEDASGLEELSISTAASHTIVVTGS